jgi:signal transduction histidine kinase
MEIPCYYEAIDQALAESVGYYSAHVEQARNLFLGMLGHDMRSPLQAIQMTAVYLSALNNGEKISEAARRLINSGSRMQALLDDMLDFNRANLGLGIAIAPGSVDLAKQFAEELDLLRAAHPDHRVDLEVVGDSTGVWDGRRLQQLLGNLVLNAFRYGASDRPVRVVLRGMAAEVCFEVKNSGPIIEPCTLDRIFDPLNRGVENEHNYAAESHLGLGLYIAREIAEAHGGTLQARSDVTETVFSVRLPRSR